MKKIGLLIVIVVLTICYIGYHWCKRPMVSVVMLTYKRANIVSTAIDSILNQTYKDFEFIILNDGSPDNTDEIISRYKDKRIRYYKNQQNKGISYSRNKVTKLARGKYIMIMDDDDISLPQRIEKQVKLLEEDPKIDVAVGQIKDLSRIPLDHNTIASSLIQYNNVGNANVMFRKEFMIKHNIKYPNISYGEDWYFWVQMLFNGAKFKALDEDILIRAEKNEKFYKVNDDNDNSVRRYIGEFFSPNNGEDFYKANGCEKVKMIKRKNILSPEFIERIITINCN